MVPGQDLQAALDERFGSDRTCQEYWDVAMAITDTTRKVGLCPSLLLQWELPDPWPGMSEDRSGFTTYNVSSQEGNGFSGTWSCHAW